MKNHSNYLAEEPELKNLKVLFFLMSFLLITDFVMPQYFGVHIGYDLTCTRFADIFIVGYMFLNPRILTHFWKTTVSCVLVIPLAAYLFVSIYTMILRTDLNSFFLIFLEVMTFFLLIYGIRYVMGWQRAIRWSIGCAYFLSIYGVVEYVYGRSIFLQFLATVPTPVKNSYRSGHYRIMGPCGHSLAYGLLLLLLLAIACIDIEKDEVNLFKRPVLVALIFVNVFLTGSRSTLGIVVLEMVLIFLFSGWNNMKKSLLILCAFFVLLGVFLLLFGNTGVGKYVLMQITSVLDQVLGTTYASYFGADTITLNNSEAYRKLLPKIFQLDWLNPILGRGASASFGAEIDGVYLHSIDNFYVSQYIKFAYPGLISYIAFMLAIAALCIYVIVKYHSGVAKLALIGSFCYFLNLWWMDALQTQKFEYILIAIFYAYYLWKKDQGTKTEVLKWKKKEQDYPILMQ